MQPIDDGQEQILAEMNHYKFETTWRCGNCGAWQGEDHLPICPEPRPVIVEVPKQ